MELALDVIGLMASRDTSRFRHLERRYRPFMSGLSLRS
jgi:hypothetical protein